VNTWDIIQIFIILAIMMGVMYLLLFLVKKYLYSFDKKGMSNSRISVLSTQTILPKKYISIIEFNNSVYLLGISDQSVNLIDKFSSDIIDNDNEGPDNSPKQNFLKLLKSNMGIK
jgi:flagellar biosynthetic protein FliO